VFLLRPDLSHPRRIPDHAARGSHARDAPINLRLTLDRPHGNPGKLSDLLVLSTQMWTSFTLRILSRSLLSGYGWSGLTSTVTTTTVSLLGGNAADSIR